MLAAAIGIDRTIEADVGRIVARDDAFRLFEMDVGRQSGQVFERAPAVVEILARMALEAAALAGQSPPAAPPLAVDQKVRRPEPAVRMENAVNAAETRHRDPALA